MPVGRQKILPNLFEPSHEWPKIIILRSMGPQAMHLDNHGSCRWSVFIEFVFGPQSGVSLKHCGGKQDIRSIYFY